MKIAIYSGSFDTFTNGHLHIVKEAICIFDKIIVAIGDNPDKRRRTDSQRMLEAMQTTFKRMYLSEKVVVTKCEGLVVDLAYKENADYLIRGIRSGFDYQHEESLAKINEMLGMKTIYIRSGNLDYISSTLVMELHKYGKDVSEYLPSPVIDIIKYI